MQRLYRFFSTNAKPRTWAQDSNTRKIVVAEAAVIKADRLTAQLYVQLGLAQHQPHDFATAISNFSRPRLSFATGSVSSADGYP